MRLYYDPKTPPDARVVSPVAGGEIGDHPRLAVEARNTHEPITRVEFLGHYEDFNWEGDGEFRQWHYITERGALARHIGTAAAPPYAVTWDTTWVPDQDQPVRIAARVTDLSGLIYMTPEVAVRLRREGRSVSMYKAADVPEAFAVRVGRKKECKIPVTGPLENVRAARLVLSTWSAAHGDEIGLNGTKLAGPIGLVHNYSFDALPVPRRLLKAGDNIFHIFSNTKEHALEVNWPGPVLLVEYGPPAAKAAPWADAQRAFRIPLEVNAAGYARVDKPAEAAVKLPAPPDPASLRVVEVGADGAVADNNVPFQLDPDGELVWLLKGRTAPHATRRYHVYFNSGRGGQAGSGSAMAVTDNVEFEGQPSLRIATPAGVYTYHKEGAGFASIADRDGVEWIGYHPGGRAAGEYRGIPNLGNDFGHPGHKGESGSVSRVESRGPLRVRIHSERHDGKWARALGHLPRPRAAHHAAQRQALLVPLRGHARRQARPEGRLPAAPGRRPHAALRGVERRYARPGVDRIRRQRLQTHALCREPPGRRPARPVLPDGRQHDGIRLRARIPVLHATTSTRRRRSSPSASPKPPRTAKWPRWLSPRGVRCACAWGKPSAGPERIQRTLYTRPQRYRIY